jgi:feruloyl esterase
VNKTQARAINKMWFGQTIDGGVPDPAMANGYANTLAPTHLWFGLTRGTQLFKVSSFPSPGLAGSVNGVPAPPSISTDLIALIAQKPALATPAFRNATGDGADGWKALSYGDLAAIQKRGLRLQSEFAGIDSNNPELTAFRNRKGKMLVYHGMADQLIPIQGTTQYYSKVAARMGGYGEVQRFYRFYQIPAMGHCGGVGSVDGIAGLSPAANPPLLAAGQLFNALTDWVERDRAPDDLVISNADATISRPLCAYPAELAYIGGDRALAKSYACKR